VEQTFFQKYANFILIGGYLLYNMWSKSQRAQADARAQAPIEQTAQTAAAGATATVAGEKLPKGASAKESSEAKKNE
jgi:hypothetical protein